MSAGGSIPQTARVLAHRPAVSLMLAAISELGGGPRGLTRCPQATQAPSHKWHMQRLHCSGCTCSGCACKATAQMHVTMLGEGGYDRSMEIKD
jgi:hypothetical protein